LGHSRMSDILPFLRFVYAFAAARAFCFVVGPLRRALLLPCPVKSDLCLTAHPFARVSRLSPPPLFRYLGKTYFFFVFFETPVGRCGNIVQCPTPVYAEAIGCNFALEPARSCRPSGASDSSHTQTSFEPLDQVFLACSGCRLLLHGSCVNFFLAIFLVSLLSGVPQPTNTLAPAALPTPACPQS